MPMRAKHLTAKLLLSLLAGGLSACADYTGPDGTRIKGPQVQETGAEQWTLSYMVEGFHPRDSTSLDYLRHLARNEVDSDGHAGRFYVVFRDKTSGRLLLESAYEAVPDLLFQKKIHLIRSEPPPPRAAPE